MLVQRPGGAAQHFLGGGITVRSGGGGARTYATILRDDYAASEIWPLVNIASGTTIPAFINSARNGTLTGWALQNAAGPVPGTLAPLSGTGDFGNILTSNGSTGLVDIFNPSIGSAFVWGQVNDAWIAASRRLLVLRGASDANRILIHRNGTANIIAGNYIANSVNKVVLHTTSDSEFFSAGVSWDLGADQFKLFIGGAQVGSTQTGLGTWNGGNLTVAVIGAINTTPTDPWFGWMAYPALKFGSIWTPAEFAAMHAAAATAGPDV